MTYEQFKRMNDQSKRMGVQPVGKITSVQFATNTCKLLVEDNESIVGIPNIINDVARDGMGVLSNPSALKKWPFWDKMRIQ